MANAAPPNARRGGVEPTEADTLAAVELFQGNGPENAAEHIWLAQEMSGRGAIIRRVAVGLAQARAEEREGRIDPMWACKIPDHKSAPLCFDCCLDLVREAVVEEREACAKIADYYAEMREAGAGEHRRGERCRQIARDIRKRGV